MVDDQKLNEWIEKCRSKSRDTYTVILRNALINYLFFNIDTQQKLISIFLNFDRSTISTVTKRHSDFLKNKLYKEVYDDIASSNINNIYNNFVSENK